MNFKTPSSIKIGGKGNIKQVEIGGNAPISIQTMWKEGMTDILQDRDALLSIVHRMEKLQALGCDIIRFAVPDMASADALVLLAKETDIPLVGVKNVYAIIFVHRLVRYSCL